MLPLPLQPTRPLLLLPTRHPQMLLLLELLQQPQQQDLCTLLHQQHMRLPRQPLLPLPALLRSVALLLLL